MLAHPAQVTSPWPAYIIIDDRHCTLPWALVHPNGETTPPGCLAGNSCREGCIIRLSWAVQVKSLGWLFAQGAADQGIAAAAVGVVHVSQPPVVPQPVPVLLEGVALDGVVLDGGAGEGAAGRGAAGVAGASAQGGNRLTAKVLPVQCNDYKEAVKRGRSGVSG